MAILTTMRDLPSVTPSIVDQIVDMRYKKEISGFIWNGVFIDTARESQTKIDSASRAATNGMRKENSVWKCGDPVTGELVYRETTNAEMVEIAAACFTYVQECFDREGVLVTASKRPDFDPQSILVGWP